MSDPGYTRRVTPGQVAPAELHWPGDAVLCARLGATLGVPVCKEEAGRWTRAHTQAHATHN